MNKAWMIRNDGKFIPVEVHPYIFVGDLEPTYAFEWLYKNTKFSKIKELILDFIYIWAIDYLEVDPEDIESELIDEFSSYSSAEMPITSQFIKEIGSKLVDRAISEDSLEAIEETLSAELDQEFLRARFGGAFNSDNLSSGEIVFRISSECFNWYNIIFDFISKNEKSLKIKCVTIVRDTGLFDKSLKYYKTHDGFNKGKVFSEESRKKMSIAKTSINKWKGENNPRHINPLYGELNGRWKGGILDTYLELRSETKDWFNESMKFCGYKCVITGDEFDNVHHTTAFRDIVDEVFEVTKIDVKPKVCDYSVEEFNELRATLKDLHAVYGFGDRKSVV